MALDGDQSVLLSKWRRFYVFVVSDERLINLMRFTCDFFEGIKICLLLIVIVDIEGVT